MQYQTNWFAKTVLAADGTVVVFVHPPINLTEKHAGSTQTECSAFRAWLGTKLGDANWYTLGEQPGPGGSPPVPQQDFVFEPPPYSFKPTTSWTCASPIAVSGSGRFPQQSAIADVTVTATSTPAGTQLQTTTFRKASVTRPARALLPAGAVGSKTSAVLPDGKLATVKAGSARGVSAGTKVAIGIVAGVTILGVGGGLALSRLGRKQ